MWWLSFHANVCKTKTCIFSQCKKPDAKQRRKMYNKVGQNRTQRDRGTKTEKL